MDCANVAIGADEMNLIVYAYCMGLTEVRSRLQMTMLVLHAESVGDIPPLVTEYMRHPEDVP